MTVAAPPSSASLSRRNFLTGRRTDEVLPLRPPWTTPESIAGACTACGGCIAACPQSILTPGSDGRPVLSFAERECTFCGRCADACAEPVFGETAGPAFTHVAAIGEACFASGGIHCQTCGDACPEAAIRFRPRVGGPPLPEIDAATCSGCGACLAVCPADAVTVQQGTSSHG
jgi:ferredoxin-type protein NapF